jgi:FdrA protein
MVATIAEIRSGAYYDSVVLMQLQRSLAAEPGVLDAGVVMGTGANKGLLRRVELATPEVEAAAADDLVIIVKAETSEQAQSALDRVDALLEARRSSADQDYLPKSIESAIRHKPEANWVLVSVPGRYAAAVTRDALRLGRHVFLYSDNVTLDDEKELKMMGAEAGQLVMGPDCGTAIINGAGLGFANHVRRGPIGLVAASGTGLQQVSARVHQLGSGVSHAIGTGGRDLTLEIGAVTAQQGLELLRRDPGTEVIVLISKPPSAQIADKLLMAARGAGKPVVVDFVGYAPPLARMGNVAFASTFDEAAEMAVELASRAFRGGERSSAVGRFAPGQRYLRGLFSGGTLAYEALLILQAYVPVVKSNVPLREEDRLHDATTSQGHVVVDLGEDEFTVGRLHPMMDNDLRIRRIIQEAGDPEVAVILLDVVLGYGAHPDPASELAPVIADVRSNAAESGRHLEVVAVVVGTDEDPQDLAWQIEQLEGAGARVETSNEVAVRHTGAIARGLNPRRVESGPRPVNLTLLEEPVSAINVGLVSFAESLDTQGVEVVQVDWRPPAGGNERLMAILERMKG